MASSPRPRPTFKLWLETDEGMVFGPGLHRLLRKISEEGTLKAAAEGLGMSYRFAWGLIHKAEEKIGEPLVVSHKGGRSGGGGAELTEVGHRFIDEFSHVELILDELVNRDSMYTDRPFVEAKAVVKGVEDRDGERVVILALEPGDVELTLSDRVKDLRAGDRVKLDVLALSGSLEKDEG